MRVHSKGILIGNAVLVVSLVLVVRAGDALGTTMETDVSHTETEKDV
jgi:hypothetical protein